MKLGWQNLGLLLGVFLHVTPLYSQQASVENFVELLLPVGGRDKRTAFMPQTVWGKNKPPYRQFDWQRFDSQHFRFYTYAAASESLPLVVQFFEENYQTNSEMFGVDGQFNQKIPIIFYQTREDFEQTHTISGIISESLGGVTEPFSWKRVVLPFEGDLSKLEHVVRHEGTHIYQVASNPKLPLWFIEGSAETNSIYWDATAETILRDGFLNNRIPNINELWQIQGTWLMYKVGNFIANYIVDTYGKKAIRDIFIKSRTSPFSKAVEAALGISVDKLNDDIRHELNRRYGHLPKFAAIPDLDKEAEDLGKSFLVAGYGKHFLSGKGNRRGRLQLSLNHYESNIGLISTEVVVDRHLGTESLHQFQSGGDLNDNTLLYTVKVDYNDAIRRHTYAYDAKKRHLTVSKAEQYRWAEIDHITDPTIIDDQRLAFIGITNSRAHIYLYHIAEKTLIDLTPDNKHHITGLDYSSSHNSLVYAKELQRTVRLSDYNYDLFLLNLDNRNETRLTTTDYDEKNPRFSTDGSQLLFTIDKNLEFNQALYTFSTQEFRQITQARIGVTKAEWAMDNRLYMVSPNEFTPHIYLSGIRERHLTGATNYLEVTLRERGESRLTAATPPMSPTTAPAAPSPEIPLGPMRIVGNRLQLIQEPIVEINGITTIAQDVYLSGKATQKNAPETTRFFKLGAPAALPIGPQENIAPASDSANENSIKQALLGRTIMQSFVSTDKQLAIVRSNNILSLSQANEKRQTETSLWALRFAGNIPPTVHEIKGLEYLASIRFNIQELRFLADNHALIVTKRTDVKNPRLRLGIIDIDKQQITWPFAKTVEYQVSEDLHYIAARLVNNDLMIYDISQNKLSVVAKKARLIASPSMGFTTSGALAYITSHRRSKAPKQRHYDLNFLQIYGHTAETKPRIVPFTLPANYRVISGAFAATFSQELFTFALHCRDISSPNGSEALFSFDSKLQSVQEISNSATRFKELFYADALAGSTLFYQAKVPGTADFQPMWYDNNKHGTFLKIETAAYENRRGANETSIIFEGNSQLHRFHLTSRQIEPIADETAGFVLNNNQLIFSRFDRKYYQLFKYDWQSGKSSPLTRTNSHLVRPKLFGQRLFVEEMQASDEDMASSPALPAILTSDRFPIVQGELSKNFRLRQLAAAAAFDGERFRYFLTAYADNLFSDQSLYINSILFSDELVATVGFMDHNTGYGVAANFSDLAEVRTAGLVFQKSFLLDEFREIKVYNEYELQDYPAFSPQSPNFISDPGNTSIYYIAKLGAAYGMDETVWDRHGPFAGKRVYLRTEIGLDIESGSIANTDANLDLRLYHAFWPRVGLAHRLMAGISRGDIPTRFLLGGNISFRGVGFDNLEGNQYWVVSEDVRLPIFDFIGAKFPDPVDNALGFLTRYFDVRGGLYGDVGAVWLEDAPYETLYSVGYFFNIPTIFRLTLRFNQGIIGEDGIDIWLGYNW